MEIFDNVTRIVRDDLTETIKPHSRISIAAACFSIYAYQELKKQLSSVDQCRFIFTSPTFVTEKTAKEKREFYIPRLNRERSLYGTEFEVKLRNELTQKAIARECAEWIRKKATFKSNSTQEGMQGFMNVDSDGQPVTYMPINGFTTVDIGCDRGRNVYNMVNKFDAPFSSEYMKLFERIWSDEKHVRVKGVHMDNTGGRYSKQYMVENTHEGIVSHEIFDKAQTERARRKNPKIVGVQHTHHDFTGLIECGVCGMRFNHKVNSSGLKWQNPIWACHNQLKHTKKACDNTRIKEDVLCDKFVEAYNRFVIERPCGHSVRAMEIRVKTLQDEERDLAGLALKHLIPDAAFRAEQKKLKAEIAALTERICEQTSKEVTEADYTVITEYDPEKVKKFVTKVIVLKGTVSFVFYNGVEITLEYSNGAPGNKPGWNAKEA